MQTSTAFAVSSLRATPHEVVCCVPSFPEPLLPSGALLFCEETTALLPSDWSIVFENGAPVQAVVVSANRCVNLHSNGRFGR